MTVKIHEKDDSLIKIHKKRLNILIGQAASFGKKYCPPHIIQEIRDISGTVRDLYQKSMDDNSKRLQLLKQKKAIYGLNSDPSLDIEIEDLDRLILEIEAKYNELELYTR